MLSILQIAVHTHRMDFGIVIVALGYELYGSYAYNLTLSIKSYNPNIRVCLLHSEEAVSHLKKNELSVFDQQIIIPEEEYLFNGKPQYQYAKLLLDKFTPFENTVYLDADTILLPDKKINFQNYFQNDFTISSTGYYDAITAKMPNSKYQFWGNTQTITKHYNLTKLPQTISDFICFKKGTITESIFDAARTIYKDNTAPTVVWAGGKADEFCFNVALAQLGIIPEIFIFNFFDKVDGMRPPQEIYKNYFGLSVGGSIVPSVIEELYNRIVHKYSVQLNKMSRHYHINKKTLIPERNIL